MAAYGATAVAGMTETQMSRWDRWHRWWAAERGESYRLEWGGKCRLWAGAGGAMGSFCAIGCAESGVPVGAGDRWATVSLDDCDD